MAAQIRALYKIKLLYQTNVLNGSAAAQMGRVFM